MTNKLLLLLWVLATGADLGLTGEETLPVGRVRGEKESLRAGEIPGRFSRWGLWVPLPLPTPTPWAPAPPWGPWVCLPLAAGCPRLYTLRWGTGQDEGGSGPGGGSQAWQGQCSKDTCLWGQGMEVGTGAARETRGAGRAKAELLFRGARSRDLV